MMEGSSSYAVPVGDDVEMMGKGDDGIDDMAGGGGGGGGDGGKVDALDAAEALIEGLEGSRVHQAHEVFSWFTAWSNRIFFGIVAFGGGKDYNEGLVFWKYIGMHQAMLISQILWVTPPFYVAGMSYFTSVLIAVLSIAPVLWSTPFVEAKLFQSKFLAVHFERNSAQVQNLRKGDSWCSVFAHVIGSIISITAMYSATIFWVYPYVKEQGDLTLQTLAFTSLAIYIPIHQINYPYRHWQTLVKMHQEEVTNATKTVAEAVKIVLFDETLEPKEARRKLSRLTHKIILPLQRELRIWSLETFCIVIWMLCGVGTALWVCLMNIESRFPDFSWPGEIFRFIYAGSMGLGIPLMSVSIVQDAIMPWKAWSIIREGLVDARHAAASCEKFCGSHPLMQEWLMQNDLSLKLFGLPVDDTLPGKMAGGILSLLGVAGFTILRSTGYS